MDSFEVVSESTFQEKRDKILSRECELLELDNGQLLLVGKLNGRWVIVPKSVGVLLELLQAEPESLPPDVLAELTHLVDELNRTVIVEPEPEPPSTLNTVILKITNACNYTCKYCYDYENPEKSTSLDTQVSIDTLKQAVDLATHQLHVIFHGGEPTLFFSRIKQIVSEVKKYAMTSGKVIFFSGQTNASKITADLVSFSEENSISWGISLDGSAAINDQLRTARSRNGTYEDFFQSYAKYPRFFSNSGIKTTVTSVNCAQLLDIARHFRDLHFGSWDWSLFQDIGRGRATHDLLAVQPDKLVSAWNAIFAAVLEGEFEGFKVRPILNYLESFLYGSQTRKNMCMRRNCGAGRDLLSISSDGVIEACDCIDKTGPLSNLGKLQNGRSGELSFARDSAKAKRIRSRNVKALKCRECLWLTMCGGTCLAHAGDIEKIWDPECALALNAFEAIANSVARSDNLRKYRDSCYRR